MRDYKKGCAMRIPFLFQWPMSMTYVLFKWFMYLIK